jgi:hypothetical protein
MAQIKGHETIAEDVHLSPALVTTLDGSSAPLTLRSGVDAKGDHLRNRK